MTPETHRLITRTEPWLQWANAHGVRDDDAGKSFDEILQDCYSSSDVYPVLLPTDPTATTCAAHEAVANTACARVLLIEDSIGRLGGDLDFYADPVLVLDPEGRIVPRRSTPERGGWQSFATLGAFQQEVMPPHDFPTTGLRP